MRPKIIFLNTHPIQYFAPLYQAITARDEWDLEVWYGSKHGLEGEIDRQFGTSVKWDIPILEGYKYRFLDNYSPRPGFYKGFFGLVPLSLWRDFGRLPKRSVVVVHGWVPFIALWGLLCARLRGHIVCLRAESPLSHELLRSKKSLRLRQAFFRRLIFPMIQRFLYLGKQNKAFYEYYGVAAEKLVFAPYAVNNAVFKAKATELLPQKQALRLEMGLPSDAQVILYSGKLMDKKRPLDLLEAFRLLPNRTNTHLVFVGDGELRGALETQIATQKITHVHLTGFVNQSKIPAYYALADVFVMCSDVGETWGLSTNEAMNFGLPVIVTDRTGNSADLVGSDNGFVVPTGDVAALSTALAKVLAFTPEQRAAADTQSRTIIEKYSYDGIIEGLQTVVALAH